MRERSTVPSALVATSKIAAQSLLLHETTTLTMPPFCILNLCLSALAPMEGGRTDMAGAAVATARTATAPLPARVRDCPLASLIGACCAAVPCDCSAAERRSCACEWCPATPAVLPVAAGRSSALQFVVVWRRAAKRRAPCCCWLRPRTRMPSMPLALCCGVDR